MSLETIENHDNLYGNILFLSPDGDEMFRAGEKKARWYLKRDLVEIVSEDPCVLRLKFEPKGKGHDGDTYYLSEKNNKCVVCNSEDDLTKHHVVPYEFRRLFPVQKKESSCHDIVLLCDSCHDDYNAKAANFYRKLQKEVETSRHATLSDKEKTQGHARLKALGAAKTLVRFKKKLPEDRIKYLEQAIKDWTKKDQITEKTIQRVAAIDKKLNCRTRQNNYINPFAVSVVNRYDPDTLSVMWREHFIQTMEPKFLPMGWDVEKPL